jgi:hypothetical protein
MDGDWFDRQSSHDSHDDRVQVLQFLYKTDARYGQPLLDTSARSLRNAHTSSGTNATARIQAPLALSILMGNGAILNPKDGGLSRFARFGTAPRRRRRRRLLFLPHPQSVLGWRTALHEQRERSLQVQLPRRDPSVRQPAADFDLVDAENYATRELTILRQFDGAAV